MSDAQQQPGSPAVRTVIPEGTLPVGAGLLITGLTSYAFFKVGQQALGKEDFKPVMALWFVMFTLAPGFFIPVEQELGRALAHRRALGQGGRPVVRRTAPLAAAITAVLVVAIAATSPWITASLFEGHVGVTAALFVGVVGYALGHLSRGIASGSARFRTYGAVLGIDSLVRIIACIVLWLAGVTDVWAYAAAVAVSPLVAVGWVWTRGELATDDGPSIELRDITPNLGWLLLGSIMSAALVNAGPLGVDVLAASSEAARVTAFGNGVILSRVPLFLFQAVQAALLPRLARLAARGDIDEFRAGFRNLTLVVGLIAVVGVAGSFAVGPAVLDLVYGGGLDRRTLGLLALASGLFMLAQACALAVIALRGHRQVAIGWLASIMTFVVVTALVSDDLFLRVELGLVAACSLAFGYFVSVLRVLVAAGITPDAESMIDGVLDNPLEG
ncbi:MAG: hypothetical protein RLZZ305_834 [Actinomycetota bacterium]